MKKILNILMVTALVAVALTVVAFAAVDENHAEMELNLTPVAGQTDIYELTATCSAMSTMQTVELMFTFDKTVFTPVNASTYKNIAVAALRKQAIQMLNDPVLDYPFTLQQSNFTDNGNLVTLQIVCTADLDVRDYHTYEDFTLFRVVFKATADNVAALTSEQFSVNQALITVQNDTEGVANHRYGYNYEAEVAGTVDLINNVVEEVVIEPITVPVLAGDKVYLQDGTSVVIETAGDYEVPATVGYVAVNTGKNGQKTYYIDGTTATEVHVNGAVGSDDLSIRAVGMDDVDANGKNRSGLRFKMGHNAATRNVEGHKVTEVGFLMTAMVDKVVAELTENPVLTIDKVAGGLVKQGKAFSTVTGENMAYDMENDDLWIISGIFYGVPLTTKNVQTVIVSRPYYMVGDVVVYGEQTSATLFDVAKAVKASEGFDDLAQYQKDYVNEIIGLVETEITEDEVIIDIGDLYVGL